MHFALETPLLVRRRPAACLRQTRQGGVIRTGDGALSPAAALERYIERKYLSGGQNTLGDDTSAPAVSALLLWPSPAWRLLLDPLPPARRPTP